MKVLVTNSDSPLAGAVAAGLEGEHEVRRCGWDEPLEPGAATAALVAGVRAVVHFGYPRRTGDADELLDVADGDAVAAAAAGMDAIINLSVLRRDNRRAFAVNLRGNYHLAAAAVRHGIRRIINTGPHYQLAGPQYEDWDFALHPDMPPAPGSRLYALTKALGQEVLRVFSEDHDLFVQTLLFMGMRVPGTWQPVPANPDSEPPLGRDLDRPFVIAWPDTGTAIRAALEVEPARLPSRCETYFVFPRLPHGKFCSEKITRVLGWRPAYHLEQFWMRSAAASSS